MLDILWEHKARRHPSNFWTVWFKPIEIFWKEMRALNVKMTAERPFRMFWKWNGGWVVHRFKGLFILYLTTDSGKIWLSGSWNEIENGVVSFLCLFLVFPYLNHCIKKLGFFRLPMLWRQLKEIEPLWIKKRYNINTFYPFI